MSDMHESSLLVVVVDIAPAALVDGLPALKVFLEAHVLMRPENRIVLLTTFGGVASYVRLPRSESKESGETLMFAEGKVSLACEALHAASLAPVASAKAGHPVAAAVSMATCFIHRWQTPPASPSALTKFARILLMTDATRLGGMAYRPLMNCVFSAQKLNVLIDCLNFSRTDADIATMQQACFMTGGTYIHAYENVQPGEGLQSHLLPLLVYHFLPSQPCRSLLSKPAQQTISFHASCFETGESINIGYLCSVCLSVTRRKTKACLTCGAPFPLERKRPAAPRRTEGP